MSNNKSKGSKKYVKFGALMKGEDGGYYIALDKELKLNVNGKNFDGKYIRVEEPKVKYQRMLEKGVITEEECESKIESISPKVRQELTIVLE